MTSFALSSPCRAVFSRIATALVLLALPAVGCSNDGENLSCPAGQVERNGKCGCASNEQLADGKCTHIDGRLPRVASSLVDGGGNTGSFASLALDRSNYPHLSYQEKNNFDLRYATVARDTGKWKVENVDVVGDVAEGTAIGLYDDATNVRPVVIYRDESQKSLKGAFKTSDGWVRKYLDPVVADPAADRGTFPSVAVQNTADKNIAHIAYIDNGSHDLYYLKWDLRRLDEISRPELVDPGFSDVAGQLYGSGEINRQTSIALTSKGTPVIAYRDDGNGDLKVAVYNEGSSDWTIYFVDDNPLIGNNVSDVGEFASLAIDSVDNFHVAYYWNGEKDLKYAHFDGSDWNIEVVDRNSVGKYASIAVREDRSPFIGYYDEANGSVRAAHKRRDGTWQIAEVTSYGISGVYTRLALTDIGTPAIAYREFHTEALYFQFVDTVFP